MIIWSGHGYLVAVLVFVVSLLMELGTESAFGDEAFYQREAWPLASALLIAGALSFAIGLALNRERIRVDPITLDEFVVPPGNHSLFFIKMQWWGPILLVISVIVFVQRSA